MFEAAPRGANGLHADSTLPRTGLSEVAGSTPAGDDLPFSHSLRFTFASWFCPAMIDDIGYSIIFEISG